jgi:hypothetical protein
MKTRSYSLLAVIMILTAVAVSSCVVAPAPVQTPYYEAPPTYGYPSALTLLPVPGAYAYFAPTIDIDVFFYRGNWYHPYRNQWYQGRSYNGPWNHLAPQNVPGQLRNLPRDYRRNPGGYNPIPHQEVERNWDRWEKDKRWDSHKDWRDEKKGR